MLTSVPYRVRTGTDVMRWPLRAKATHISDSISKWVLRRGRLASVRR